MGPSVPYWGYVFSEDILMASEIFIFLSSKYKIQTSVKITSISRALWPTVLRGSCLVFSSVFLWLYPHPRSLKGQANVSFLNVPGSLRFHTEELGQSRKTKKGFLVWYARKPTFPLIVSAFSLLIAGFSGSCILSCILSSLHLRSSCIKSQCNSQRNQNNKKLDRISCCFVAIVEAFTLCVGNTWRHQERLTCCTLDRMWRAVGQESDHSWGWCDIQPLCTFRIAQLHFYFRYQERATHIFSVVRPQATTCPLPVYHSAALPLLSSRHSEFNSCESGLNLDGAISASPPPCVLGAGGGDSQGHSQA